MTLTEANAAIMTTVVQLVQDHAAYPLVIETDNRDVVDLALQEQPYLQVTVDFMGADQISLGEKPRVKQHGQLLLCAVAKGGTGKAASLALLDFVMPYFDMESMGGVEFHAAEAAGAKEIKGLWRATALVNFYFTRIKI